MKWVLLGLMLSFISCDYYIVNPHHHTVGYISKNEARGSADFAPCFEERIFDYYYFREPAKYRYGKDSLRRYFQTHYDPGGIINDSGYITIRFVINCRGEAGRYKITELSLDYKEKKFNSKIVGQIFNLLQSAKLWNPSLRGDIPRDSYIYYTFKIINGELVEILP